MRISITLPGFSRMVPVAREAVRVLLPGNPREDDARLIVSEFATNAIRHSLSRGASFELALDLSPGRMRIEMRDAGPFEYPGPPKPRTRRPPYPLHPWTTMHDEDRNRDRPAEVEEYGHGSALIAAAADKWGHSRYPDHAVWWAELAWPARPPDASSARARARDAEAVSGEAGSGWSVSGEASSGKAGSGE